MRLAAIDHELALCERELESMMGASLSRNGRGRPHDHESRFGGPRGQGPVGMPDYSSSEGEAEDTPQQLRRTGLDAVTQRIITVLITGIQVPTYEWKKSSQANRWAWIRKQNAGRGTREIGKITVRNGVVHLTYQFDHSRREEEQVQNEDDARSIVPIVLSEYRQNHPQR